MEPASSSDCLDLGNSLTASSFVREMTVVIDEGLSSQRIDELCDAGSDQEDVSVDEAAEFEETTQSDPDDSDEDGVETGVNDSGDKWIDGDSEPNVFPFRRVSGTTDPDVMHYTSPLQFLRLFITDDIVERIVTETNRYAASHIGRATVSAKSRYHKWHSTTVGEMWGFFGLITAMGMIKIADLDEYWSQDEMYSLPFFSSTLSRDYFLLILTFLHCNNNDNFIERGREGFDALFKIRPFLDTLNEKFLSVFYPGQNLALDETLVASCQSPLSFQVFSFNPDKPTEFGMKVYQVFDSFNGYCSNFEVYCGKGQSSEKGATYDMSMRLMEPFLDVGHQLFINNFYTSPTLLQDLAARQTNACGIVRPGTKGLPSYMKNKKLVTRRDMKVMTNGTINMIKFFDKKEVNVLSTIHGSSKRYIGRQDRTSGENIQKLEAIIDYRKNMGCVDRCDQMLQHYSFKSRALKWWKKLFFHFFTLAELNAYIMYKSVSKSKGQKPMELRIFQRELSKEMSQLCPCLNNVTRKRLADVGESSLHRLTARHFPTKIKGRRQRKTASTQQQPCSSAKKRSAYRRQCCVCTSIGKRRETTIECAPCDVGLCIDPCFNLYHTQNDYKRAKRRLDTEENVNEED